mgnify:CR=1 FL=1
MNGHPLILSIFPGIDLLGRAFEEVWPEAALIRDSLGVRAPAALVTLSEDTIERIKADVAARVGVPYAPEPAGLS